MGKEKGHYPFQQSNLDCLSLAEERYLRSRLDINLDKTVVWIRYLARLDNESRQNTTRIRFSWKVHVLYGRIRKWKIKRQITAIFAVFAVSATGVFYQGETKR